jgi:hypothetical protein
MNGEMYDEADPRRDLALQHEATIAAVHLLHACGDIHADTDADGDSAKDAGRPA